MSHPAADICEVVEFRLKCFARSPATIAVRFRSASSFKRLHLVRVGYGTQNIAVSPGDSEVRTTLKPRSILVEAGSEDAPRLAKVRGSVNQRLRDIFFGPEPPSGLSGFEFLGAVRLAQTRSGKFEVVVPVMVADDFRVEHLAAITQSFRGLAMHAHR